jgi:hypothetical protein
MTKQRLVAISILMSACGAEAVAPPDGGGGIVPLTPRGAFLLHSEFDLADNLPGEAGKVIDVFLAATDGPDDPTRYVVDLLVAALPDGHVKNIARSSAPFIAGFLNDRLLDIAPSFVTSLRDLGNKLGQVGHHFGLREELDVTADGRGTHTVTGVHFEIDRAAVDYLFADESEPNVVVGGVAVTLDDAGTFAIAEHTVPLSYGQIMKLALDKAVIPLIDPAATDLGDLFARLVDCAAVGEDVYEALDLGSASSYEAACIDGLAAGAGAIYAVIDHVDSAALELAIAGTSKAIDLDRDGGIDRIQTGTWTGTVSYAGSLAPLGEASFYGEKR